MIDNNSARRKTREGNISILKERSVLLVKDT